MSSENASPARTETSLTISVPLLVLVEQFPFGAYNLGGAKRIATHQKLRRRRIY